MKRQNPQNDAGQSNSTLLTRRAFIEAGAALGGATCIAPALGNAASGQVPTLDKAAEDKRTSAVEQQFGKVAPGIAQYTTDAYSQSRVEVATTVALLEGPASDRLGNVYFSDLVNRRILKLSAGGMQSVYREHSNVAIGLLIDPQGRLIACEGGNFAGPGFKWTGTPRVTRTTIVTGAIEILADSFGGKPLVRPNDVTIDGKGRLYFTDMEGASVYRIDGPGKVVRILAAPDVGSPNGIQVSPDDRTLYLVESGQGPSDRREIRAIDLLPDGSVRNPRTLYKFFPGRSADGMSIDVEGNLYASAGMNKLRDTSETLDTETGVYVISPAGRLLKFIPILEDLITNNTFGGEDMKTLYVTAGRTLYKVRMAVVGLRR